MNSVTGQQQRLSNIFICTQHFMDNCLHNLPQYEAGFSAKDGAVPTVHSSAHRKTSTNGSIRTERDGGGGAQELKHAFSISTPERLLFKVAL